MFAEMKKILLLIFLPFSALCQNTIGLPDIINYSKQNYSAGLQNWDIRQDKNGIMYFANNEGLLSFDGQTWNLYALPNKTIARSVEIGFDNRIYVGGQDELGYFSPAANGLLQYQSLTNLIPTKDKSFGDVWDIVSFNKNIFFRSTNKIFKLTNNVVETFDANSEWAYLGICDEQLYAHDYKTGIMHFENGAWVPLLNINKLPDNDPVTAILSIQKDSILITTLKDGLFILSQTGISKIPSANRLLFENDRIYAATRINNEWIALATNNSGIYIIDLKGNIIQSFSRVEGLQNNNVLSIFLDRESNLWLGLDNGIDFIAYNSAIKNINPLLGNGSGYTAAIFNNHFFAGTTNGLYSVPLQAMTDLSFSKGVFKAVDNAKGQTWGLAVINNQLLVGKHEGAFVIKNNKAESITSKPGFWNFVAMSNTFPAQQMVAGNYKGLTFFNYSQGQFQESAAVNNFSESSRFVEIDNYKNIWVSHPYHGIYKISKNKDNSYDTHSYTEKNGLPSTLNNHVYKIKNEIVFATGQGIYTYNQSAGNFEPSPFYAKLLGNLSIRYLKEDVDGNIWFIHDKKLGVIDMSAAEPVIVNLPELNNKLLSGFEFIYPVNKNNIFIGGEKGFFHVDYEKYKKNLPLLQAQIRTVSIINKTDSLLFGGYFKEVNDPQIQSEKNIPRLNNDWKTIRFQFSSSIFDDKDNLEYSYRLKGYDDNWSEWTKRTEKEYTNLPSANCIFQVMVRNNLGKQSAPASYSFTILPPWYQTGWAYILYLLFFIGVIFLLNKILSKKFKKQQTRYEEEQKKLLYIHELEINKTENELVTLRNEKLETEVNFKNSELASTAMHLVKKGELVTKIKEEIQHVMKNLDNPRMIADFKKIIKTLNEDDNMDKEWENFSKHFDKVHSDFLVVLKDKHPTTSANELKLSAYLRMNLSTKEIAKLMNISVRGVDISRYRLRKKLQLATEISLFDYLISIHTKS